MEEHPLSLYELNALVKRSIHACLPDTYWVQAELSDVRSNYSGHCYLEFVQKEPRGNNLIAKARGTIWSNVYRLLKPYFEEETGQAFVAGIKVMVKVAVEFHELYGYSLTVQDIDPTYTLGDMARRRREILKQLEEEGVLTLNKELEIPLLAQRIAVISSATAAGYGDFCNQLEQNPYGFVFYPRLFPAIMQGERVEQSVITALDAIHACRDDWDVVVIIRGGGATSDLSGFDTYELAANCAQCIRSLLPFHSSTRQIAERILQGVPRSPLQNHYGIPASGNIEDPPDKTLPLRAFPDEPSAARPHLQRLSPGPSDFPFPAQECRS